MAHDRSTTSERISWARGMINDPQRRKTVRSAHHLQRLIKSRFGIGLNWQTAADIMEGKKTRKPKREVSVPAMGGQKKRQLELPLQKRAPEAVPFDVGTLMKRATAAGGNKIEGVPLDRIAEVVVLPDGTRRIVLK